MDNSGETVKDEKVNINNGCLIGKKIDKLVEEFGSKELMNKDNKNMLGKITETGTFSEAFKTLMKDPDDGRELSFMESRMRFG